jgi:hypothetical protein
MTGSEDRTMNTNFHVVHCADGKWAIAEEGKGRTAFYPNVEDAEAAGELLAMAAKSLLYIHASGGEIASRKDFSGMGFDVHAA